MRSSRWIIIGALLGGLSVALGAFGAHGLKARFAQLAAGDFRPQEIFETAARYHAMHALAILLTAALLDRRKGRTGTAACWAFLVGVVLFSGSLYLLATTGVRWLGAVTPIGGLSLIAGWVLLAVAGIGSAPDPVNATRPQSG